MLGRTVQPIYYEPSLELSWKIFFATFGIKAVAAGHSFNLPSGCYTPALWLLNEQISVEVENYSRSVKASRTFDKIGEQIRYQEAADHSAFPVMCIKGLPQTNRYSVRLFAPRNKAHIYPKFYWASFAEGEGQKLCLIEGDKHWYLKRNHPRNWPQTLATPNRNSELIIKALDCANAEIAI